MAKFWTGILSLTNPNFYKVVSIYLKRFIFCFQTTHCILARYEGLVGQGVNALGGISLTHNLDIRSPYITISAYWNYAECDNMSYLTFFSLIL